MKNGLLCLMLVLAQAAPGQQPVLSDPQLLTNGFRFRVSGESNEIYLIERSRDLTNWTPVAISTTRQSTRTVIAPATNFMQMYRAKVLRGYGIHAASRLDLNGHALESDSFDSSDPAFSTDGKYDPSKRRDEGHVAVYSVLTNAGGDVRIRGRLWMGPEGQTYGLSSRASIGSGMWVDEGRTGVQPGYLRTNLSTTLLDAPAPLVGGYAAFPPGGVIDGEFYDYFLMSGVYRTNGAYVSSSEKIFIHGDVTIYFSQGLTLSGSAIIRLGPAARLQVWSGGSVQLGGQGVQGLTRANQFTMFGLQSCTNIGISTSNFIGWIYAPSAHFTVGPTTLTGSCTAQTVTLTGAVTLHFDEIFRAGFF